MRASELTPIIGVPDRVTVYTGGQFGDHVWIATAKLAMVTVVGAGGSGGKTGKWLNSGTYYYNAGGGGSAGAQQDMLILLRPGAEPAVPFAVGDSANDSPGGATIFGPYLRAEGGVKGNDGSSSSVAVGAATSSPGLVTSAIYGTGSITRPRAPGLLPGEPGKAGTNTASAYGSAGGGTLYGHGGSAVQNPASGAPLQGLSPAAGQYGGGGSGGASAPSTVTSHTIPAGKAGGKGLIIVREWA